MIAGMGKTVKSARSATTGKFVTQPIGARKAAKFAAVEGVEVNAASREISRKALSGGLRGDAYRAEIAKAFKKS